MAEDNSKHQKNKESIIFYNSNLQNLLLLYRFNKHSLVLVKLVKNCIILKPIVLIKLYLHIKNLVIINYL